MLPDKFADRENLRHIFLSDGNYIKLVRKDPYGFWYIEFGEGRTPDQFKDAAFTEIHNARMAVNNYVENEYSKYASIVSQPVQKAEPLKVKKEKPIFEGTSA